MSFGKMNTNIDIVINQMVKDTDGFTTNKDCIVANAKAYYESKNSTKKWINMASNTSVNALFRLRVIPNVNITTDHFIICNSKKFNVYSVENVRGRNMYYEILAQEVSSKDNFNG